MATEDPNEYIYCHLASGESEADGRVYVNLQRGAWRRAVEAWLELKINPGARTKEACVNVIVHLGQSLSDLLGQNIPPEKMKDGEERTPSPGYALDKILFENMNLSNADWEAQYETYGKLLFVQVMFTLRRGFWYLCWNEYRQSRIEQFAAQNETWIRRVKT